jgi:hypothetical protein
LDICGLGEDEEHADDLGLLVGGFFPLDLWGIAYME